MGEKKDGLEKDNNPGSEQGDRPAVTEAKKKLIEVLTTEQGRIPKDHPDWLIMENFKEDVLRDNDPKRLAKRIEFITDILERLAAETLAVESSK